MSNVARIDFVDLDHNNKISSNQHPDASVFIFQMFVGTAEEEGNCSICPIRLIH